MKLTSYDTTTGSATDEYGDTWDIAHDYGDDTAALVRELPDRYEGALVYLPEMDARTAREGDTYQTSERYVWSDMAGWVAEA